MPDANGEKGHHSNDNTCEIHTCFLVFGCEISAILPKNQRFSTKNHKNPYKWGL
jgi:hypothetical protein